MRHASGTIGNFQSPTSKQFSRGFSLIELLVVLAIIGILSSLSLAALQGETGDLNKAIGDIALSFQTAKAYAMANHTHVFVGLAELQPNQNVSGVGRVVMGMAATIDGTSDYDESNVSGTWSAATTSGALVIIHPLQVFNNLHLADFTSLSAPQGPMATRETPAVGLSTISSLTPFSWPLNSASATYNFTKVVEFRPDGTALIQTQNGGSLQVVELDLQPTHGGITPSTPQNAAVGNIAAIQIDGITGLVAIYRP